jgi:multisubunit Na+/H+ antiporter MnhF subunit
MTVVRYVEFSTFSKNVLAVFYVIIYCGGVGICFALIIVTILLTFLYTVSGLKWQIINRNMNRYLIT